MKTFRIAVAFVFCLNVLLSFGAMRAAAQGATANMDDPAKAIDIDNALHTIAAKSPMWFRFDYTPVNENGDRIVKTVRLVYGNHSGVRFEVWTPDHVNDWWDNQKPIGRGTLDMVDCDTGQPSETGECQSNDLTWVGGFGSRGTYYVRVFNENNDPVVFTLTIN